MRAFFTRVHLLSFIGGVLFALGFPSFLGPPLIITPIMGYGLLFYALYQQKNKLAQLFWITLLFSAGFNITGFYWIGHTLSVFGELPLVISYFLNLLFSFFILPHVILLAPLFFYLQKTLPKLEKMLSGHVLIISSAFLLTVLEYIVPQQFPVYIAQSWLPLGKYLGLAPITGLQGFSFFCFWIALELARYLIHKRLNLLAPLMFLIFFALNALLPIDIKKNIRKEVLNIRVVQANIGNLMKISSEQGGLRALETVKNRYRELSLQEGQLEKLDLIIWPETAYPHTFYLGEEELNKYPAPPVLSDVIEKKKTALLTGGYNNKTWSNEFYETQYNGAFLFGKDLKIKDFYHKRILIPFGETLPFGYFNKYFSSLITNIAFFAKGERFTHFKLNPNTSFISPICYEILSSSYIADYLNAGEQEANFIVNLTNDSWYGDTAEPRQHLFLAKWMALQFNIPIIRSTNTGITSVIYPDGSESPRLKVGEKNFLEHQLKLPKREKTLYQKFGLWISFLIFLTVLGIEQLKKTLIRSSKARL